MKKKQKNILPFENVDKIVDKEEKKNQAEKKNEKPLTCQIITNDILFNKYGIDCIPIKICQDPFWPDEKSIAKSSNGLLESNKVLQQIVQRVEFDIMDLNETYKNLENSSLMNELLKGIYILHNCCIDIQTMIKHNNYVLATLFQNKLPGQPVLWHMIFLYILAERKFPLKKKHLFAEIQFLGEHAQYFINITPHLNPPIIENLNLFLVSCLYMLKGFS